MYHTPLLIDLGDPKSIFSFELSWMRRVGFYEMFRKNEIELLSELGGWRLLFFD
jgi:hypothetical protein